MIKGILFDLGYTLEKPETGDWMLTKKFYSYYPKEVLQALDKEVLHNALRKASFPLAQDHKINTREEEFIQFTKFYYDLISNIPSLSIDETIAKDIAQDRTYDYEKYVLFDSTMETLQTLKEQGYKLGVLSDTWPSTVDQLEYAGIAQYFDCFTYSFQYGVLKPHHLLYEDAIKKMQLSPDTLIFVDDLPKNLIGASAYGIHPVQSLQNPSIQQDASFPSINKPSDIFALLNHTKQE